MFWKTTLDFTILIFVGNNQKLFLKNAQIKATCILLDICLALRIFPLGCSQTLHLKL